MQYALNYFQIRHGRLPSSTRVELPFHDTLEEAEHALTDLYWKFPDNEVVTRLSHMLVVAFLDEDQELTHLVYWITEL